ncbi:MAG TPA: ABC transporter permease subunit [Syntrophomonadaceae bacterium]|nr:ABC transporter permease subunit [Syntrophomonadaceae bacterium]
MNRGKKIVLKMFVYFSVLSVLIPIMVIAIWSVSGRWAWPQLFPDSFSLRGINELFGGYSGAVQVLGSSIAISLIVALLAVIIGVMTARALVFYDFRGKSLVSFGVILPIIIPSTVFAMGIHVLFIKMGLSDTVLGVIIVHLICSLPYAIKIITDMTAVIGKKLEEQASVLGATPGQILKDITIPCLLPGLISSASLAYIISFGQYFITLIIGGGSVKTFSMLMVPYLQSGDRTVASAYSMVFICSTLIIFIVLEKTANKFNKNGNGGFFA